MEDYRKRFTADELRLIEMSFASLRSDWEQMLQTGKIQEDEHYHAKKELHELMRKFGFTGSI